MSYVGFIDVPGKTHKTDFPHSLMKDILPKCLSCIISSNYLTLSQSSQKVKQPGVCDSNLIVSNAVQTVSDYLLESAVKLTTTTFEDVG